MLLDLSYDEETYKEIEKNTKTLFSIDDHENTYKSDTVFLGNGNFATCVYTWKIFYPKKNVPRMIQYIGASDSKKHAKFLPLSHLVVTPVSFRYTHSPYIGRHKWEDGSVMKEIWELIENENDTLWIVVGQYMHEVQENIKEQVARNAVVKTFQGYQVAVLNFNDPVLSKRIARQILDNMKAQGKQVHFCVMWGYEYTANAYKVQLTDDHRQTVINLPRLARILGKTGGYERGGHGHSHTGNFYWVHTPNRDIWDLFTKSYLTQQERNYVENKSNRN